MHLALKDHHSSLAIPPVHFRHGAFTMSFPIYLVGFLIVIGGIAWGLSVAGVSTTYIMIAVVIMVGLGILSGVAKTRQKDPPTP